jgi:EmrB/QacA subfamily drug resistance transporter
MATTISDTAAIQTGSDRRRWIALAVLSLGLAIVLIDATVVNVSIPAIRADFGASLREVEWVNSLYSLVYAAFIITWGGIADLWGRRRMFVTGVAVFVLASAACGAAPNIGVLIAFRAVQGLGAAMLSPATLSILSSTFKGRERGIAFGVWGATAGASAALGPILGGWFTTDFSWRWIFWINIPVGAIAIVGSLLAVQESRDPGRRFRLDPAGIALSTLGVGAIIFGLIEGQGYGWGVPKEQFSAFGWSWPADAPVSIVPFCFAFGAIALAAFVFVERWQARRGLQPLFDLDLLEHRGFRFGLVTVLIVALGEFSLIFVLSLFLQSVQGLTALEVGVAFLGLAIATMIAAPLAGFLSSRVGAKWAVTSGMCLEAIAIFSIGRVISTDTNIWALEPLFALYGVGVGLAIAQLTNLVLSDIPPAKAGIGSGANNTARQLGAALGVAILGAILSAQVSAVGKDELAKARDIPAPVAAAVQKAIDAGGFQRGVSPPGVDPNSPTARAVGNIFRTAATEATRAASVAAAAFVALGALSSLFLPNRVHGPEQWEREKGGRGT